MSGDRAYAALLVLALGAGCQKLPYGEVLVVADTDVAVPDQIGALEIDLYDESGAWFQSRQVATLERDAWPVSFGVSTDGDAPKRVRVRLRAFPDGHVRDYRGAPFAPVPPYVEPSTAASLDDLCNAPPLPAGQERTLRYDRVPLTPIVSTPSCQLVSGGAAAAAIVLSADDSYHFEVVRAFPDGAHNDIGGNTVLWLRSECYVPGSQVACNDDLDAAHGDLLSGFDANLTAGSYTLFVGGVNATPADVTIKWSRTADWSPAAPDGGATTGDGGSANADGGGARLIINGADQTPATEPQPGVTIDRVFDVEVEPGTRRTAGVLLTGECFGTPADLAGARACVATAGQLEPIATAALTDGIDRGAPTLAGSWAAAQPQPCTATPRAATTAADGAPLYDDEVCVPGGAFRVGDLNIIGTPVASYPEQIAVVDPFLMDRYEVTVGRYRAALAAGFDPPIYNFDDPFSNPGPIAYSNNPTTKCTFSGDASGPAPGIAREPVPLICVSWYTARLFCQFEGGDLPTLAQWEFAARMAGKSAESTFPWGDEEPTCDRAWYDHGAGRNNCPMVAGAIAVDAVPWSSGDVTPQGVVGLAGNVDEWVLDSGRPFSDPCWWQKPLRGVGCFEKAAPMRYNKGGFYAEAVAALRSAQSEINEAGVGQTGTGFRCVRPGS
ncbi:MAG TPA: SUMF1/EgtB/PvdO family nonheme iron enzyme [Polyangia bacterium]|nr:SUMF1/EgtB/PvdO family nonheme iron enzyme [Polyangia bacterium]